jgi:tetratricopeptide (TPR) repeat protein
VGTVLPRASACLLCLVALALPAHAGAETPGTATPLGVGISVTWDDFVQQWEARRHLAAAHNYTAADQALLDLLTMKERSGWTDLFSMASAVRLEAKGAAEAGYLPRALALTQVAIALAPHDPDSFWSKARLAFREHPAGVGTWLALIARAAGLYVTDWRMSMLLQANIVAWVLETLLLFTFVIIALLYIRHGRYCIHDFNHLFPRAVSPFQSAILAILILAFPLLMKAGVAWCIVAWTAVVWWSLATHERVVVSLLLACWVLTIGMLDVVLRPVAGIAGPTAEVYEALVDPGADLATNHVLRAERDSRGRPPDSKASPEQAFVMGVRALRGGTLAGLGSTQTLQRARELLAFAATNLSASPVVQNAYGVALMRAGDTEGAGKAFAAALQRDPHFVFAHFNLSRLYYANADLDHGNAALKDAARNDPNLSALLNDAGNRFGKDFAALGMVPRSFFALADNTGEQAELMADELWGYVGEGSRTIFCASAGVVWLLLMGMALVSRKTLHAHACPRCGKPVCRRCNPELPNENLCSQCYHTFVVREGVDQKVRLEKDIQIRRYQARSANMVRVIGIVVAGAGHVLEGRLLGIGLLLLFVVALVFLCPALGIIHDPLPLAGGLHLPRVIAAGVLLLCTYGISLWSRIRED